MSEKPIPYDGFARLTWKVYAALQRVGPCTVRTLVRELREDGYGPNASAVNKVLTEYLVDRVARQGKNEWIAVDS
jgi:hypothetical protein